MYGSVRGVSGNRHPYRDLKLAVPEGAGQASEERRQVLAPGMSLTRDAKTKVCPERSSILEADPCLCRNVPCEVKGS